MGSRKGNSLEKGGKRGCARGIDRTGRQHPFLIFKHEKAFVDSAVDVAALTDHQSTNFNVACGKLCCTAR
jgi:hypothetical protein